MGTNPTLAEDEMRASRLAWAFVALGLALRIGRYALNFPIWWDESFVAVNLLQRRYLDLLRPLDYGQVCPLLFLWAERAAVDLFGFSEWTLRLFPWACGLASVVVFRGMAGLVLKGPGLVLAVAIFAVSYHPIRHAADVKPYASDLLAALLLLTPAFQWWRRPDRTGWLWLLASLAPLALVLSHPAIFIASGIGLALAPAWWRGPRRAIVGFGLASALTFGLLYLGFTRAQAAATLPAMRDFWARSFPPLDSPARLLIWLVEAHTGDLLAYPCGGPRGGSAATLALVIVGAVALVRDRRGPILTACLAPLGLALLASALRRYPYGGAARFMQYAAPAFCLLAGLGGSEVLGRLGPKQRGRGLRWALVGLALVGIVPLAADATHPYRSYHSWRARAFARRFWPAVTQGAEVVCLRWDVGVGGWDSIDLDVPVYLCNQAIYGAHRRDLRPVPGPITPVRPLRCIVPHPLTASGPDVRAALGRLRARREPRGRSDWLVATSPPGSPPRIERYLVFEFGPPVASGEAE